MKIILNKSIIVIFDFKKNATKEIENRLSFIITIFCNELHKNFQ